MQLQRLYGSSGDTVGFRPGDGKEGIEAHEKAMEKFELEIVHDDADIVVVNKPAGALCVPGRFIQDSLVVRVAAHIGIKDFTRMVVHRLDQGTSGVLVFAKNDVALKNLHAQLRPEAKNLTAGGDGGMQKKYVALVEGDDLDPINGRINLPLSKDMDNPPKQMVDKLSGKPSLTEYTVRSRGADSSLVELRPITGRTHQLRVHLSCTGHPILGDPFYASLRVQNKAPGGRLCLHAESLVFRHPTTQERVSFSTRYPKEWDEGMVSVIR
jgi:tRNA pseudouridine32 synthase/23S rRNA pseudouridine746 synthase|eukprot:evm.model.NODE_13389_length_6900_cov_19.959421.2